VFLPPYGPALSPIKRVWRDVQEALARPQFTDLEAQQKSLSTLLQASAANPLRSLTSSPSLVEAMDALRP
jgi:transposase